MNAHLTLVWVRKWDDNWIHPRLATEAVCPVKAHDGWIMDGGIGLNTAVGALSPTV